MLTALDDKARNVIPRWRDFSTTAAIGELKSSKEFNSKLKFSDGDFLASKLRDWKTNRSVAFAADVVGAAFVLKRFDEAVDAAKFLVEQTEGVSKASRLLALKILNSESRQTDWSENEHGIEKGYVWNKIRHLRHRLREEPRNSIAYVDLARAYTLLDEISKAKHVFDIALRLSPNNRFILRSAARFFIHIREEGRAHEILRKSEATRHDTWLLAAEIAVASATNQTARFTKNGQRILNDGKAEASETTELSTALAMLELENGKARNARKLFRKALISPTENSIAQIEWVSRNKIDLPFANIHEFENVPLIYEAKAYEYYALKQWDNVLRESWNWFFDQPFSESPVIFGSYIATVFMGDYDQSINILEMGRIANPNLFLILNNLAFSYASTGQVVQAQKVFNEINLTSLQGIDKIVAIATEGLIDFRSGNIDKGRAKYMEAINLSGNHEPKLKAKARIFLAREERIAKTPQVNSTKELALEDSKAINDYEVIALVKRIIMNGEK